MKRKGLGSPTEDHTENRLLALKWVKRQGSKVRRALSNNKCQRAYIELEDMLVELGAHRAEAHADGSLNAEMHKAARSDGPFDPFGLNEYWDLVLEFGDKCVKGRPVFRADLVTPGGKSKQPRRHLRVVK